MKIPNAGMAAHGIELCGALCVALVQLSCSSSSSGGMADTSVHPGCMVPGTYVPTAKRSTTNPGTCPANTELLLQREDIVIPATAMAC
ncbi:MAG TPA: hypothetical protein VL137_05970 [Polyangiaceae bacterium]|nr:hypothetical protein [Polyangiaceae bacterium]